MKLAPLAAALLKDPEFQVILVHSGQHYDERMSGRFFVELGLPSPAYHLGAGSGTHASQTAEVMKRIEPVLEQEQPNGVVVVGDVNSTMAAALVASKLHIPVVHVEAGLRSRDRTMPEEINRLVTDAVSDLLLVTEQSGVENLGTEGVPPERIRLVGNLMIDTLLTNVARASKESRLLEKLGLAETGYGLVTLHRPSNVDDPAQLNEILSALDAISETLPLVFPVHPRTRNRLKGRDSTAAFRLLEPLGYLDFLALTARSSLVLTDSGGVQEETTALGIPCLTIRENTERPVTIDQGTNRLAGACRNSILAAWVEHQRCPKRGRVPPLWDGHAADRCHLALRDYFLNRSSDREPAAPTA